jgi:hypothetical protein
MISEVNSEVVAEPGTIEINQRQVERDWLLTAHVSGPDFSGIDHAKCSRSNTVRNWI